MIVPLPDVNVLIALFDPAHPNHDEAHHWWQAARQHAWATCPMTTSAFVRILSNPAYPSGPISVVDAVDLLRTICEETNHQLWPDDISLLDRNRIRPAQLRGHRQIADACLLALAVSRDGQLVTFDRSIPRSAVAGAEPRHIHLLGRQKIGPQKG